MNSQEPKVPERLLRLLIHYSHGEPDATLPPAVGDGTLKIALDQGLLEETTDRISGEVKYILTEAGGKLLETPAPSSKSRWRP